MNKDELAEIIFNKLLNNKEFLKKQFDESKEQIGYFYLDNLEENYIFLDMIKMQKIGD